MEKDIQELLIRIIKDALNDLGVDAKHGSQVQLDFPSDERFGDFSTNIALQLSKLLRKSPRDIADNIIDSVKKHLKKEHLEDHVGQIRVEGAGFINFYLKEGYFYAQFKDLLKRKSESLKKNAGKGKRVLIEFVSANPTGSLSVAHARQAVVGDALASVLGFLGYKVDREYYLNDEGNQINILGKSVDLRLRELNGEEIVFPENYYQGDYIYDIARAVKDKRSRIEDLGEYAGDYILAIIKKELDDFGVEFDCWYSQKSLRKSGKIEQAFEALKKKGYLYEQEGALWFKSTAFGDDKDRVVIKSDGSHTYLAPDIAYHEEKYKRGFEWLINLWGPDHHGYIARLKASVAAFGHDPDSLSVIIVQLASIYRDGKIIEMSTRKGQYITLREVLDEVGKDAARFFFLMRRTSSHLDFDLEVAKKQTAENPVYYVQYAHARICSILRNSVDISTQDADLSLLKEKEELGLIKKSLQLPAMLHICLSTQDPYMLTIYLQELAESFHKFYDLHRVLVDDPGLSRARLALIEGTRIVIGTGLELLGISAPEKM